MSIELKRKYLVNELLDISNLEKIEYVRYFLSDDVIVKSKNGEYEIEGKGKITFEEFLDLTKDCKNVCISDSYLLDKNTTLKIYHGKYEGLIFVEVEFESIKDYESFKAPSFFSKEITEDILGMDTKLVKLSREEFLNCLLLDDERIDDLELDSLKLIQNKKYFCFGMDSVLLANFVESNNHKNVIIDYCSGSGVIPIIISHKKKYSNIFAVELQKEMYNLLVRNIYLNDLVRNIIPLNLDIKDVKSIKNSIFEKVGREEVDIIVCNPPYKTVGTGMKNTNFVKYAARNEVLCTLEDIFISSSKMLKSKGKLYLCHKPERIVDLIDIARKYNLEVKRIQFLHPKLEMQASVVLIEYVKDGGNEAKVLPPIIEYDDELNYTNKVYSIYGKRKEDNIG